MKLNFRINKPLAFVMDHLTDMQKYTSVHPVITKIDNLGNNHYLVHETLKMAFIPISFTYPVTIENNADKGEVIFRATIMKITKIEMHFIVKAENKVTHIEETIQFKSPLPIKSMMESIFKKQHRELFNNMDYVK